MKRFRCPVFIRWKSQKKKTEEHTLTDNYIIVLIMNTSSMLLEGLQRIDEEISTAKHVFHNDLLHIEKASHYFVDQAHSKFSSSFVGESSDKRNFLTEIEALEYKLHMAGVINSCLAVILRIPGSIEGEDAANISASSVSLPRGCQPCEFVQKCNHLIDELITNSNKKRLYMLRRIQNIIIEESNKVTARLGPNFPNSPESKEKRCICIKSETFKCRYGLVSMAINMLSTTSTAGNSSNSTTNDNFAAELWPDDSINAPPVVRPPSSVAPTVANAAAAIVPAAKKNKTEHDEVKFVLTNEASASYNSQRDINTALGSAFNTGGKHNY